MRGPKPKTHEVKALSNSRRIVKDKQPPQLPIMLLECPSTLTEGGRAKWQEIASMLFSMNLSTAADTYSLGALCEALSLMEQSAHTMEEEGTVTPDGRKHPAFSVWKESALIVAKFAEPFGLTPIARERLKITPRKEPSAFEKFLAQA